MRTITLTIRKYACGLVFGSNSTHSNKGRVTMTPGGGRSCLFPAFVLSTLLEACLAGQYISDQNCSLTFADGNQPAFLLPEAGGNNPGDTELNINNSIVHVLSK